MQKTVMNSLLFHPDKKRINPRFEDYRRISCEKFTHHHFTVSTCCIKRIFKYVEEEDSGVFTRSRAEKTKVQLKSIIEGLREETKYLHKEVNVYVSRLCSFDVNVMSCHVSALFAATPHILACGLLTYRRHFGCKLSLGLVCSRPYATLVCAVQT